MSLIVLLVGMGVLMGAAAHLSTAAFAFASAAIALWLAGFAVRERIGGHRGRPAAPTTATGPEGTRP